MKNLVFFKDDLRCNICNLAHINEMCITHSLNDDTGEIRHYFELRQFKLNRDENTEDLSQVVDFYQIQSDILSEATESALLCEILALIQKQTPDFPVMIDFSDKAFIDDLIKEQ